MKRSAIFLAAAIYASGALFTFGHAWQRNKCTHSFCGTDTQAIGSALAAAAWPLYLSVILQEPRP